MQQPQHRTKAGAASAAGLGKAIINRRARDAAAGPKESGLVRSFAQRCMLIMQYVLDESNPLQSVTQERDLDEFLANAALADTDFATGKYLLPNAGPNLL